MQYFEFIITDKQLEVDETYIVKLKPKEGAVPFKFSPGNYVFLKNPEYLPDEQHPFSIASSPIDDKQLAFCIKIYGDWTREFVNKNIGDTVLVSEPQGNFVWDDTDSYAVFLLGGIGISPIMSMLRYMYGTDQAPTITMIYGNRTPETIAYNSELKELEEKMPHFNVVHVFSHIDADHPWQGYRGFVTDEIVKNEVDLDKKPTFYIIGPPIFIDKMVQVLDILQVPMEKIKTEKLEETR